jgi:hypothetical protein
MKSHIGIVPSTTDSVVHQSQRDLERMGMDNAADATGHAAALAALTRLRFHARLRPLSLQ